MSIQIGNVTINVNPEQQEVFFIESRPSQFSDEMEDGEILTYDSGITKIRGFIDLKYVKESEAEALRSFIVNNIRFKKYKFSIIPPSHIDYGLGKGVQIDNCTFANNDASTDGVFSQYGRLDRKNIFFEFTYVRPVNASVVDAGGVISA